MQDKSRYSVLFVEDEREIRENYTKYLKRHFVDVYEASDGEEGYLIYINKKPDIMIVDINIPKMNGLDLAKKIREQDQVVKLIMLTAHSDTKYLLDAAELKLVKYLVKPVARKELKEVLDLAVSEFSKFDVIQKERYLIKDGYTWDAKANLLLSGSDEVYLTSKEKALLGLLIKSPNNTFAYDDIIVNLWDDFEENKIDALKTIIKNLRKKLPDGVVKNVFGVGYRFFE